MAHVSETRQRGERRAKCRDLIEARFVEPLDEPDLQAARGSDVLLRRAQNRIWFANVVPSFLPCLPSNVRAACFAILKIVTIFQKTRFPETLSDLGKDDASRTR